MEGFDLAIVGAGPAGITAAIYAVRRNLKVAIFENGVFGGYISSTDKMENYPPFPSIKGMELAKKFEEHLRVFPVTIITEMVVDAAKEADAFILKTDAKKDYKAQAVILSTGTKYKKLGVPGEARFMGKGVSFCATCDAPFFKGKAVAVVGGGDSALVSANVLADVGASKVCLIHRRGEFKAEEIQVERAKKKGVQIILNSEVKEIIGDKTVEKIKVLNNATNEETLLEVSGLFVNIGSSPFFALARQLGAEVTPTNYIKVNLSTMETAAAGVFAAGDVTGGLAQVVTATAQGAQAALSAYKYLQKKKGE